MNSFILILDSIQTVFSWMGYLWWIYTPFLLFFLAYFALRNYFAIRYFMSLKWVLLEIKVPKENRKSPKAMEQVFAGLHGVYGTSLKWRERTFGTKFQPWFSFEIVGKGGETHFYVRTQEEYRNLVESQIYAQFPTAEVIEAEDYVNSLPYFLPDDKYDLWGNDFILTKPDAFPIRTYPAFEEKGMGRDDPKRIDPLASLSEFFSTIHPNEQVWIQILSTPADDGWVKQAQLEIDRLMGKAPPPQKSGFLSNFVFFIDSLISGPSAETPKEEEKRVTLSPGKQEILKAVEASLDKIGFYSGIRFVYIGQKDNFHRAHVSAVSGAFKQFSSQNLNGFKMNRRTLTYAKGLFKKAKLLRKKRAIYRSYRDRKMFIASFYKYVLTIEELATIFHFPDTGVQSPLLPRVEAKTGEPPVGLPRG